MSEENQNDGVVYGSDEYYEQTGENGTTINNKPTTTSKYRYNAELYFWENYHNRLIRNNVTYENMFCLDDNGTKHLWHRKRKAKYIILPDGSLVYPDALVSFLRYDRSTDNANLPHRQLTFIGILGGKAYYVVKGSLTFEDNDDHWYIADSDDGLLITSRRYLRDDNNSYRGKGGIDCFISNHKGKVGHFIVENYRLEDDPYPNYGLRHKVFCYNFDGLNYTIDLAATDQYGDGDELEPLLYASSSGGPVKGELFTGSNKYPIFIYSWLMDRTDAYDSTKNLHNFAYRYTSQYLTRTDYSWYKIYNANTKTTIDFPFITNVDVIGTWWYTDPSSHTSANREIRPMAPTSFNIRFLRAISLHPSFGIIGTCPNGNVLIWVSYSITDTNNSVTREYWGQRDLEYYDFNRFSLSPIYFVIDSSGNLVKSGIQEPIDYDVSSSANSSASWNDSWNPVGVYTDEEYLWFRKPYLETEDITFYGTRDGSTIDKQIVYYNRTTLPFTYQDMVNGNTVSGSISKQNLDYYHIFTVPLFEDGVFVKYMVGVWAGNYQRYSGRIYITEDLTPNANGILEFSLLKWETNNRTENAYQVRQSKKETGQSDDDYIFEME